MKKIIQLIPVTAKGRRSQLSLKAEYITIHSTGNPNSTAKNEASNIVNNHPEKQVSFHWVVDDKEAYQVLPNNEVGWHAGDGGSGPGNRRSIGIEICESGDRKQTLLNAAELVRDLMAELKIDSAHIVQHNAWSGKDCPRILRNPSYIKDGLNWGWFLSQLKSKIGLIDRIIKAVPIDNPGALEKQLEEQSKTPMWYLIDKLLKKLGV
ncbi:MAG: N-acetylmuramoyl-L-alanine amidase [Porphyromonadaceae bacterium]|nr:N-acetylmuramoyl-L-alanine amidase [Porphyromonadaceae bacterium]